MKFLKPVILSFLVTFLGTASAASDEVALARYQLDKEIELIETISPYVERLDQARLQFIKRNILAVQSAINSRGLSNVHTLTAYQQLIVSFRYSVSFFQDIQTRNTAISIEELLKINDQVIKARGFDDSPYTQITKNIFSQMYRLVLQLTSTPILNENLDREVKNLVAPIGKVIAIAELGDRPKTFTAAIEVQKQIASLYREFDRIARSNVAFDIILEIQGLNEFYAEFAQVDE